MHQGEASEEVSPIVLNDMQVQIMADVFAAEPIIAVQAGWGSGKTSALVFAMQAISYLVPGGLTPLVLDTRPRYDRVLHLEIKKWCGPLGWTWHERKMTWTDPHTDSSFVVVPYFRPETKSSSHNPLEGVNGTSGYAIVDECQLLTSEVAEKLTGRIRSGPKPVRILVGLPEADAWWVAMAVRRGCEPIFAPSSVNARNLGENWLEDAAATISEEEHAAMVENKPQAATGVVYHEWVWKRWPDGNLAPDWWVYRDDMPGYLSVDPGTRKPSALVIVHDEDERFGPGGADIVVAEVNTRRLTLADFTQAILAVAWPRSKQGDAPGPRYWLDDGVIDRAGRQARDVDLRSTADELEAPIVIAPDGSCIGGLGLPLHCTTDADKIRVSTGVQRVKRLVLHQGRRRLLCSDAVYREGMATGKTKNSLYRALREYKYPSTGDTSNETPNKTGIEDPVDALRYWAIRWRWYDGPGVLPPTGRRDELVPPPVQAPQHRPESRWQPGGRR